MLNKNLIIAISLIVFIIASITVGAITYNNGQLIINYSTGIQFQNTSINQTHIISDNLIVNNVNYTDTINQGVRTTDSPTFVTVNASNIMGVINASRYSTVEAAIAAAANLSGIVQFGDGTYNVTVFDINNSIGRYPKSFTLQGSGKTILRVPDNTIVNAGTGGVILFYVGKATADEKNGLIYTFRDLTIDGNGDNQNFSTQLTGSGYNAIAGISGSYYAAEKITIDNVRFTNFTMNRTKPTGWVSSGAGINTGGFRYIFTKNTYCYNSDWCIWVTKLIDDLVQKQTGDYSNTIVRNPIAGGIKLEGTGDSTIQDVDVFNDTYPIGNTSAIGVSILTSSANFSNIIVDGGRYKNISHPIQIGGGSFDLKNSIITNQIAEDSIGSFDLQNVDNTTRIAGITARNIGKAVTGETIWGAIMIGHMAAPNAPQGNLTIFDIRVRDSPGGAGIAFARNVTVVGGFLTNNSQGNSVGMGDADANSRVNFHYVTGADI